MTEDITAEIADRVPGWSYSVRPIAGGWVCDAVNLSGDLCVTMQAQAQRAATAVVAVNHRIRTMEGGDGR